MSTHHTLGAIQIPRGLVWADEFAWHPVLREAEYSITGALLLDSSTRLAGRPITLQGSEDAGWLTRTTLLALYALAENASALVCSNEALAHVLREINFPAVGNMLGAAAMLAGTRRPKATLTKPIS